MPTKKPQEPPRRNRMVMVQDAAGPALDGILRKRGFARRDLVALWRDIAPAPYGEVAIPEKLAWPRGAQQSQGAVLHLRCHPAYALRLRHEAERVAAAINRYFGYVLIDSIRLSLAPFAPPAKRASEADLPPPIPAVTERLERVDNAPLRAALDRLGRAVHARARSLPPKRGP